MKITQVECLVLDRQYLFVRVYTDEGLVGIGECFRRQFPATKATIEEILAPVIIGEDPLATEALWDKMHRAIMINGVHGFSATAMAGIDICLVGSEGESIRCAGISASRW